jgi:hypothetical protein
MRPRRKGVAFAAGPPERGSGTAQQVRQGRSRWRLKVPCRRSPRSAMAAQRLPSGPAPLRARRPRLLLPPRREQSRPALLLIVRRGRLDLAPAFIAEEESLLATGPLGGHRPQHRVPRFLTAVRSLAGHNRRFNLGDVGSEDRRAGVRLRLAGRAVMAVRWASSFPLAPAWVPTLMPKKAPTIVPTTPKAPVAIVPISLPTSFTNARVMTAAMAIMATATTPTSTTKRAPSGSCVARPFFFASPLPYPYPLDAPQLGRLTVHWRSYMMPTYAIIVTDGRGGSEPLSSSWRASCASADRRAPESNDARPKRRRPRRRVRGPRRRGRGRGPRPASRRRRGHQGRDRHPPELPLPRSRPAGASRNAAAARRLLKPLLSLWWVRTGVRCREKLARLVGLLRCDEETWGDHRSTVAGRWRVARPPGWERHV